MLSSQVSRLGPSIVLLQHRNDLLFRKPCSLHQSVLRQGRTLTPFGGKTQWQVKSYAASTPYTVLANLSAALW